MLALVGFALCGEVLADDAALCVVDLHRRLLRLGLFVELLLCLFGARLDRNGLGAHLILAGKLLDHLVVILLVLFGIGILESLDKLDDHDRQDHRQQNAACDQQEGQDLAERKGAVRLDRPCDALQHVIVAALYVALIAEQCERDVFAAENGRRLVLVGDARVGVGDAHFQIEPCQTVGYLIGRAGAVLQLGVGAAEEVARYAVDLFCCQFVKILCAGVQIRQLHRVGVVVIHRLHVDVAVAEGLHQSVVAHLMLHKIGVGRLR